MSELGDAFGTVVEGGLFAKAVGGKEGQQMPLDKGHFAEGQCLNCGADLVGSHCHRCGQKAHLHRTLGAFLHDLLHGALHFEGKTWKTLPKLAFKPGELTRRYIEGERARYVSPMALFLFSIFLMFAVFQMIGLTAPTEITSRDAVEKGLAEMREDALAERDELAKALAQQEEGSEAYQEIANSLEQAQAEVDGLDEAGNVIVGGDGLAKVTVGKTGWAFLDKGLDKWRTNPSLMLYKLQANGYKFSWMLIPISIPFVWLLFAWRRKFKAYDHAIFVTYSIAFMSLFFIVLSMLIKAGAPEWLWGMMLMFIPPIHIYKQLRRAYSLSRFSALWRLVLLLSFINVIVVLFLQLLLVIGAF